MNNETNVLPITTHTLAGVADELERSSAKSIIIGSINADCCSFDILDQAERILERIEHTLDPKHPYLKGYVILTPHMDEDGLVMYNRYAISFDLLDRDEAALMMENLPSDFYRGCDDVTYLKYDWENLDAEEAIEQLRFIHEQGDNGYGYKLPAQVEMYPFIGSAIQLPHHGRLAVHLGARPRHSGIEFLADA